MTLRIRNRFFLSSLFVQTLVAAFAVVMGIYLLSKQPVSSIMSGLGQSGFLRLSFPFLNTPFFSLFLKFAVPATLCVPCGLWLFRTFSKNPAAEISYLMLILACFGLEALRMAQPWFLLRDAAPSLGILATRIVVFTRLATILAFLLLAIHAAGFDFDRSGRGMELLLFLSLILASIIPVNSGKPLATLMNPLGYGPIVSAGWLTIFAASVFTFLAGAYERGNAHCLAMAGACLLMGAGLMAFYTQSHAIAATAGCILFLAGVIAMSKRIFKSTMWI